MKIAIQTRTVTKDYNWYSKDRDFKTKAEEIWSCWHNENYDGAWFGFTSQNGEIFFLAGKIPTKRYDNSNRIILDFVVLQPDLDSATQRQQLAQLTSDLLKNHDINNVDSPFVKWVDEICVSLAEKAEDVSFDYTPESSHSSESGASIGRFEYPLSSEMDRTKVANALGALLESGEDFLVGCIQYPVEKFIDQHKKAGYDLSNSQIAVFSNETDSKKEIPGEQDPFPPTPTAKNLKAMILVIAVILFIVSTFGYIGHQNAKKANQIQDLASQVQEMTIQNQDLAKQIQDLTTQNQNLTNQIAKMETAITGYKNAILKKDSEIQKWMGDYDKLQEEFAAKNLEIQQTIQRYEAEFKAKNAVIDDLKKQINQLQLPPPPATPADSNPVNPVNSDSVVE